MFKFLLKNLYNIEPKSFGLDISNKSYKFIQLRESKKGIDLAAFGYGDVKDGVIENGEVKNEDALVEVLKEAIKNPTKGKLTTKHVVFSLPEEHSFVRILQLPKMSKEETKEAIKWEIEQNIPLQINDVYFDWQIINKGDAKVNHQDILVAVVSKSIADPYISVLKRIGLIPVAMESESISVTRSIIKGFSTNIPVLVVDIGATITSFIIFSGKTLRFSSSVPIAGDKMIESISKKLKVDKKEAKKLFYEVGFDKKLDKDGKVTEALEVAFSELISQIKSYISFYEGHSTHDHGSKKKNIQKIILSGGVSNLYGITAHISSVLKIPTELANPWANILKEPLNEVPDLSYRRSLGYTTALGLALKGIKK